VKDVNIPSHNPDCTSQSTFTNFTHFPECSKWRNWFCMPRSKITLKMVPTAGKVHNRSLGKGTGSNCKGSRLLSSSSNLWFIVKNLKITLYKTRSLISYIQIYIYIYIYEINFTPRRYCEINKRVQ
jgi:hypothetical protein